MQETKAFRIERPNVREDGTFDGYLSVFGNKDRQGDIVEPGAFKRTLDHAYSNKTDDANYIPILWQHDAKSPIGVFERMAEDTHGLFVNGRLSQGVRQADEAYILLRDKALKGLSIGYDVIKQAFERGARLLKELRLWEGSLVTFPANQLSLVTNVKAAWIDTIASRFDAPDFLAALEGAREDSEFWAMRDGLCKGVDLALDDALGAHGVSRDERLERLDATFRQFHDAGMTWAHHFLSADRPMRPTPRSPEMPQQTREQSDDLGASPGSAKAGKPEGHGESRKSPVTDSYTQAEAKKKPKRGAEDEHDIDPQDEPDQDDEHGEYEDRGQGYDEGDDEDEDDEEDDEEDDGDGKDDEEDDGKGKGDMESFIPGDDAASYKKPKHDKGKKKKRKRGMKAGDLPMTQAQFGELREIMESLAGTMEKMVDHLPALYPSQGLSDGGPRDAGVDGSDDSDQVHSFGDQSLTEFLRDFRTALPEGE